MQAASILQKLQSIEVNLIGGWRLDPENYSALISEYFYDHTLFKTEKEWIVERYLKCIHVLQEKELCPDISLFQELQKFGSQLPLIIDQFDKVLIVFYHGDIAFRNMLAKKDCEGNYQISALLDWEWAGSRPIYVDYQWSLLEDDSPSEELEWLHQHLAGCGINPSQEIPQYSLRMDLYFFIEETLVMDHWIDSERRESCLIHCREVLDKFHSYYIKST